MRAFSDELDALHASSLLRRLHSAGPCQGPVLQMDGGEVLNFSSNDYLGLASCDQVKQALKDAVDRHGAGAGASRLVCGTLTPHTVLEEVLAAFKKTEAALTFSSGYAASLGTLTALAGPEDVLILDKLCHASLIDGAKLSGAALRIFPHNRMDRLESLLQWARARTGAAGRILVVTESVFSMDGDWADLQEIVRLKETYGALLLVDEAHAFGILGRQGRGLADKLGLAARVDIHLGTLSKAAGLHGGYVCGTRSMVDLLINRARSFIYSTAPPPAVAAAAAEVIVRLLPTPWGDQRRSRLEENLATLTEASGGRIPPPDSAILPIILGREDTALAASRALLDAGILVPAIRYPTVARGRARLRLTMTAAHTAAQIATLMDALLPFLPAPEAA